VSIFKKGEWLAGVARDRVKANGRRKRRGRGLGPVARGVGLRGSTVGRRRPDGSEGSALVHVHLARLTLRLAAAAPRGLLHGVCTNNARGWFSAITLKIPWPAMRGSTLGSLAAGRAPSMGWSVGSSGGVGSGVGGKGRGSGNAPGRGRGQRGGGEMFARNSPANDAL